MLKKGARSKARQIFRGAGKVFVSCNVVALRQSMERSWADDQSKKTIIKVNGNSGRMVAGCKFIF